MAREMSERMECRSCKYWQEDHGIFTATGWTGDGRHGDCLYERVRMPKPASEFCHHYESKNAPAVRLREAGKEET